MKIKERGNRGHLKSRVVDGSIFVITLLLPAMAVWKSMDTFKPKLVLIYFAIISMVTFLMYWADKLKARNQGWRIPESTLHFLELIGGWPAAFLSQRIVRHKISKRSYQFTFWAIALVHNLASFDFLHHWHYSSLLYQASKTLLQ